MRHTWMVFVLMITFTVIGIAPQVKADDAAIHKGSQVAFDYTLTVDGKVVDTSKGKSPLQYVQGDGKLIPGLTKQLEGLKAGDEKTVEVKPEEGYGSPNPAAFKEVPLSALPAGAKPAVGMILQGTDKNGRTFPARISEVRKDSVIMDFNHPMAGKTLLFNVKIVSVK